MKVAFVETPSPWLVRPHSFIPLGPLYLATVLNRVGHKSWLARPKVEQDFVDLGNECDVVAFSGTTLECAEVEKYARLVKENTAAVTWYGGPHATVVWRDLLRRPFDSVAIGEAEGIVLTMVRDLEEGRLYPLYEAESRIQDLDILPFPDRSLVDPPPEQSPFAFGENHLGTGCASIIASRGCSRRCAFCCSQACWGRQVRFRSPRDVCGEVRQIVHSGIRQFRFDDDNLCQNSLWLDKLCETLAAGPEIAWKCSVRADDLTYNVCRLLRSAGCREVSVGIESGDQGVLDFVLKDANLGKAKRGCTNAREAGINVRGLFIIGLPGESEQSPDLTVEFIENTSFHCITLSQFVPFPGSPIYEDPGTFDCELVTKDYTRYNKDFWVRGTDGRERREFELLIRNKRLTEEQQRENIRQMETYMLNSPLANRG